MGLCRGRASDAEGTDHPAAASFNSSLPSFVRCCWGGQSMLCLRYLKLGNVSLHLVQSGKTHELRAMNARPRLASARASRSFGSRGQCHHLAHQVALQPRQRDGIRHGRRFTPRARRGRWRLLRRPVAAPLAVRQHGVGVGLLLQHEPAVPPALGAAAHPVEDPELAQPGQRRGDRADADPGLAGDRRVGRIEPAGAVVQEVEDQRVQHLQRRVADGATMPARLVRAAVEVARPVPEAHGRLLRHRGEADGRGDAAGPHRPGRPRRGCQGRDRQRDGGE